MDLPSLPRSKKRRDEILKALVTRVMVVQELVDEAEDALAAFHIAMVVELRPAIDPEAVAIGVHHCDGSPFRHCAYDSDKDPAHDFCLFCGEPDERK